YAGDWMSSWNDAHQSCDVGSGLRKISLELCGDGMKTLSTQNLVKRVVVKHHSSWILYAGSISFQVRDFGAQVFTNRLAHRHAITSSFGLILAESHKV